MARARKLFEVLVNETVELLPEEAELAKLFTNAYRYLKFALANQLYMMANDFGLDYERIRQGSSIITLALLTYRRPVLLLAHASSRTRCSWRLSTTTTSCWVMPP